MTRILDLFRAEPALVIGVVDAVIFLAVVFGAPISDDQKVAIDGVVAALLMLGGAVVVRSQVTPVAKP